MGLLWLHPATPPRWRARSGLAFGLATICRLTDGAFALAAFAYVVLTRRRLLSRFVWWAIPSALLLLGYDWAVLGDPLDLRYLAAARPRLSLGVAVWLRRSWRHLWARAALAVTGATSVFVFALGALVYDWAGWSWETRRAVPQAALQWTLDPAQILYTAANARFDGVTMVSVTLAAAAGLFLVRLWMVSGPKQPAARGERRAGALRPA